MHFVSVRSSPTCTHQIMFLDAFVCIPIYVHFYKKKQKKAILTRRMRGRYNRLTLTNQQLKCEPLK